MKKTNLYSVIFNLNKREKSAFLKWLKMKGLNSYAKSFQLINDLIRKNGEIVDKKVTFQHLFPDTKYNDGKFRRHLFGIFNELKHFAAQDEMQTIPLDVEKYWLKWLGKKKLFDLQGRYFNKYLKSNQEKDLIPWLGGLTNYEILFQHLNDEMLSDEIPKKDIVLFGTKIIEEHLLSEILRWQVVLNNYNNITGVDVEFGIGQSTLDLITSGNYKNQQTIVLLSLAIEVSKQNCSESKFDQFSNILHDLHSKLDLKLNYLLFVIRSNFVYRKYFTQGETGALRKYYELEKERNLLGYATKFGSLPYLTYKNMVSIALEVNEVEWAKQYNEDFKKHVIIGRRENSYLINMAKIRYYEAKYDDSLLLFNQVEFENPLTYLTVKRFQAQIYYMCNDDNAFHLSVDSTIRTLNRKKSSTHHWVSAVNFFKYFRALVKLRANLDSRSQEALLELIKNDLNTGNKKWLIEEVRKLDFS